MKKLQLSGALDLTCCCLLDVTPAVYNLYESLMPHEVSWLTSNITPLRTEINKTNCRIESLLLGPEQACPETLQHLSFSFEYFTALALNASVGIIL